jgi:hypothetical protein
MELGIIFTGSEYTSPSANNVSAYLLAAEYENRRDSALDRFDTPRAKFVLDNTDGRFSPRNAAGPYYPNLKIGKRLRLRASVGSPLTVALTNLMRNPSVEFNTAFFTTTNCGITRLVAAGKKGQYGLEVKETVGGGGLTYAVSQAKGSAPVTATYTASVYVKGVGGTVGKSLAVTLIRGGGGTATTTVTLTAVWQRVSVSIAALSTDTDLTIELGRSTSLVDGELFYTDGWQLEQSATLGEYADGDQPECTWSGTAHASTSSRVGNSVPVFHGSITKIQPSRDGTKYVTVIEAIGLTDMLARHTIFAGPFAKKPGDVVLQRLLDIISVDVTRSLGLGWDFMDDGGMRFGGDPWVAVAGTTITYIDTGPTPGQWVDDPTEYDALEGDRTLEISNINAIADGIELNVTALTAVDKFYRFVAFVRTRDADASGLVALAQGRTVGGGVASIATTPGGAVNTTLSLTLWKRLDILIQWTGASTSRFVQVLADSDAAWNSAPTKQFLVDGVHIEEVLGSAIDFGRNIQRDIVGTNYAAFNIEYLDAFDQNAASVLDELTASMGGWWYEARSGRLIFEDTSNRATTPIAEGRLSDDPDDGMGYTIGSFQDGAERFANHVIVRSLGDIQVLPSPPFSGGFGKVAWLLEPVPRSLTGGVVYLYHAAYSAEDASGGSGLILRRGFLLQYPKTGYTTDDGIQTPYLENFGRGGRVFVKPTSNLTLLAVAAVGRLQQRQESSNSRVEAGGGHPTIELEMPGQGSQTTLMSNVATWAHTKYSASPAMMEVTIEGEGFENLMEIFGRDIGTPVLVRHKTGPGALYVDDLFYIEGIRVQYRAGELASATWTLEEA